MSMARPRSIRVGETSIDYTVARSARRKKTVTITLDPDVGVVVAVPMRTRNRDIEAIVRRRAGWILRKLGEDGARRRPINFVSGESVYYLGRRVPISIHSTDALVPSVEFVDRSLHLRCPEYLAGEERLTALREALTGWYRSRAEELVSRSVERWQSEVGREPARISIGSQKSLWGSCSQDGTLRFTWRIVMAPQELIDYVSVHELCHLIVANHSGMFWSHVARVMPDHACRRRRLREIGPMLTL